MTEPQAAATAAKGDFARLIGVTPGRVSQYISAGKLHGPALVGEGRGQRIVVEVAKAQLRKSLDVSQSLGNGIATRLDPAPGAPAPAAPDDAPAPSGSGGVREQLELEKLHQARFNRKKREEEERARKGLYMRSDEARAQMVKVAARTLAYVEGGLADLASEMAAKFELPARDILHELRLGMRKIRASASQAAAREAQDQPQHVVETLADEDQAAA